MRKSTEARNSTIRNKKFDEKLYSIHHLQSIKIKLEDQYQRQVRVRQQIKLQKANSNKIQELVINEIAKVENEGIIFAAKIQQQKQKHTALYMLVEEYKAKICDQKKQYQQKLNNAPAIYKKNYRNSVKQQETKVKSEVDEKIACSELQQKIKWVHQIENQYEQYILKNNSSQYQLKKKLDEVRTLRSERTVFNKVFDQFQKQIFQLQFECKELVIQRAVLQAEFQKNIQYFQTINKKTSVEFQKLNKTQSKLFETERLMQLTKRQHFDLLNNKKTGISDSLCNISKIQKESNEDNRQNYRNTFAEGDLIANNTMNEERLSIFTQKYNTNLHCNNYRLQRKSNWKSLQSKYPKEIQVNKIQGYTSRSPSLTQKDIYMQNNLNYEKKVKQICEQLKIKSQKQLPVLVKDLQNTSSILFQESEKLYEKLYEMQAQIKNKGKGQCLYGTQNKNLETEEFQSMQRKIYKSQQLRDKTDKTDKTIQQTESEIKCFMHDLKQLLGIFQILQFSNKTQQKIDEAVYLDQQRICTKISLLNQKISQLSLKSPYFVNKNSELYSLYKWHVQDENNASSFKQNKQNKLYICKSNDLYQFISQNSQRCRNSSGSKHNKQTHKSQKIRNQLRQIEQNGIGTLKGNSLQQILKANRTTHNNTSIYTEEELIEISRYNIQKSKMENQGNSQHTDFQVIHKKCAKHKINTESTRNISMGSFLVS